MLMKADVSTSAGSLQDLHDSYSFIWKFAKPTSSHKYVLRRSCLRAALRNNQPEVLKTPKNDFFR